jgi:hypothetical protein
MGLRATLVLAGLVAAAAVRAGVAPDGDYRGAGACASPNCHGSVTARADSRWVLQNEYATWRSCDRHSSSYAVLREPRSLSIARRLGMTEEPWKADKCLDCHALNVPDQPDGPRLSDGVSCEACHGPSGLWIKEHTEKGWHEYTGEERRKQLHMTNTMDPAVAAGTCLECHFGSPRKTVDHAMIAAGHPALVFELDSFAANMPPHWKLHPDNAHWFDGGAWAAGQAVALREAANALRRQRREAWPEFSQYDCFTCHHQLSPSGARPLRGVGGHPPFDMSRWLGVEPLASVVDAEHARLLQQNAVRFQQLAAQGQRGESVEPVAAAMQATANQVLSRSEGGALHEGEIDALLRDLTAPGKPPPGFRGAQETAWSLAALASARSWIQWKAGQPAPPVKGCPVAPPETDGLQAAINQLFLDLRDPATYDPPSFAHDVAAVRRQLH